MLINSEELSNTLRNIKQQLHATMNGVTSRAMRDAGVGYRVNFGVELPRLQTMAEELPHDYNLAAALWKEDIRECRLLAAMLMPLDLMDAELAEVWLEDMQYPEEVDVCVLHLWQHGAWASSQVFQWLAADKPLTRYAGYALLRRLLMSGRRLTTRDAQEFLDHAASDLRCESQLVRNSAYKTLLRYMESGITEERMGERVLSTYTM